METQEKKVMDALQFAADFKKIIGKAERDAIARGEVTRSFGKLTEDFLNKFWMTGKYAPKTKFKLINGEKQ
jgi:hypothetical protein